MKISEELESPGLWVVGEMVEAFTMVLKVATHLNIIGLIAIMPLLLSGFIGLAVPFTIIVLLAELAIRAIYGVVWCFIKLITFKPFNKKNA